MRTSEHDEVAGPSSPAEPASSGPCRAAAAEERRRVATALVATPDHAARLERRVADLARLRHPGVVRSGVLVRDGDGTRLVRERAEGGTLADLVAARGALPLGKVLAITRDVAQILEYVHAQGLVHGNLSARAVRVADDGRVRLDDFALDPGAPDLGGTADPEGPGQGAPEQSTAEAVDGRADIYALGMLLAELRGGGGDSGTPRRARSVPPDVARLIARAVQPQRAERPRSMTEMVRDIDGCRATLAVHAVRRRLAVAVGVLGIAVLGWLGVRWSRPTLEWDEATPPAEALELREGERVAFTVVVRSRLDGLPQVTWLADDRAVAEGLTWTLAPDFAGGDRPVTVRALAIVGAARLERVWRVTIRDVNRPPVIAGVSPEPGTVAVGPGVDQRFTVDAGDPDPGDALEYTWELNGEAAAVGTEPAWTLHGGRTGDRVRVVVADRQHAAADDRVWTLSIVPVRVRTARVVPGAVRPGGNVTFEMDYVVRGGPATPPLRVGEIIELVRDGHVLSTLPRPQEARDVGDWHTTAWIQVPKTAPPGTYLVRSRLAWSGGADEGSAAFTVR